MKISHCIFTMDTGGAQMLVVDMLNELQNRHDVSLIIVNNEYNLELLGKLNNNIKVFFVERKAGSKNIMPLIKLNYILYKIKPDVVHCHEPNMINFFLFRRFKCLFTVHDVGIKFNVNKYDISIAISESVAKDVETRYNEKISVIYNGVPIKLINRKTAYEVTADRPIKIVQISRLMHEKKGQDILIRSFKLLSEIVDRKLELYFIGDGESLQFLAELVKELKIVNKVNFMGNISREWIMDNLSTFDILVQPSRYEGFGLTIVEGMAAGLPVVTSQIEGPAEIQRKCGIDFMFENGNVDQCASKIFEVINLYFLSNVESLTNSVYEKILDFYTVEKMIENYEEKYRMAIF